MGILITTDLEIFIHDILKDNVDRGHLMPKILVTSLHNSGCLMDNVREDEYLLAMELIRNVLAEPRHPKNTQEQDLWCKARGISHALTNERHRKDGFVKSLGRIHTTSGSIRHNRHTGVANATLFFVLRPMALLLLLETYKIPQG